MRQSEFMKRMAVSAKPRRSKAVRRRAKCPSIAALAQIPPMMAVMKETAFLINTGRGPLVDGAALAVALKENRLAGAALDVLESEPPPADNPLLRAKNCLVTPHIAWATRSARRRLLNTAVQNAKAFVAGAPQNVVNG